MGRPELMSLDVLGTDEELRAAERDEAGSGSTVGFDGRREAEGRDGSRAVTVRMDRSGRVSEVLISNWWRDDLLPSGLGDALLAAYQAAVARAAAAVVSSIPDPAPPTGHNSPSEAPAVIEDDVAWLDDVRRRLDRVQDDLEQVSRLRRNRPAERVVSGPAGYVHLLLLGDSVSQVRVDVHVALRNSPNRLAVDALAAFQAIR
jgi:hypothetical protein